MPVSIHPLLHIFEKRSGYEYDCLYYGVYAASYVLNCLPKVGIAAIWS
jgi:hypothetical protein